MTKIIFFHFIFNSHFFPHVGATLRRKSEIAAHSPMGRDPFFIFKKEICGKGRVFCLLIPLSLLLLLPSLICLHISTLSSLSPGICMRDQVAKGRIE